MLLFCLNTSFIDFFCNFLTKVQSPSWKFLLPVIILNIILNILRIFSIFKVSLLLMIVFRCWFLNHVVGDFSIVFLTFLCEASVTNISTSQSYHQHKSSPTSMWPFAPSPFISDGFIFSHSFSH